MLALLIAIASAPTARAAKRRTPTLGPVQSVIDGPSSDIVSLDGMSVARDGTGAVVYLKDVGGVAHVFVSRLLGGSFQAPQQVDAGLAGASSQPVVAADNGGVVLVAFINGATLYVAEADSSVLPIGAASALAGSAASPSLAISPLGKAYLAYTASGGGHDVVASAFWQGGQWALGSAPLDANLNDDAGAGSGRPMVAAAGDGIGVVAWGESGHLYVRRVIGTTPSTSVLRVDPASWNGWGEVSSGAPEISDVGFSTYAAITYSETFASGNQTQSRVMYSRLHGDGVDLVGTTDGASAGGPEGADQGRAAVTEFNAGLVTSELASSHQLDATILNTAAGPVSTVRIDSSTNGSAPDAVPAAAGLYSMFIAWQQTPGVDGPAEVRVRYAPNGSDLGPEEIVSDPGMGAVDAGRGLVAGGDLAGDAAIAWVQDGGAGPEIVAAQLYQAPGNFAPAWASHYYATVNPYLSWSAAAESWGPITYSITFDGQLLGTTTGTVVRTPTAVTNGRHVWQVSAVNQAGLTLTARAASVFVDTVAPRAGVRITGKRVAGATLKALTSARDLPPAGSPAKDASGVATVKINWGDRTTRLATRAITVRHAYRRRGSYKVTVTVTDQAGNHTRATRRVRIAPKPSKKKKSSTGRERR